MPLLIVEELVNPAWAGNQAAAGLGLAEIHDAADHGLAETLAAADHGLAETLAAADHVLVDQVVHCSPL